MQHKTFNKVKFCIIKLSNYQLFAEKKSFITLHTYVSPWYIYLDNYHAFWMTDVPPLMWQISIDKWSYATYFWPITKNIFINLIYFSRTTFPPNFMSYGLHYLKLWHEVNFCNIKKKWTFATFFGPQKKRIQKVNYWLLRFRSFCTG